MQTSVMAAQREGRISDEADLMVKKGHDIYYEKFNFFSAHTSLKPSYCMFRSTVNDGGDE